MPDLMRMQRLTDEFLTHPAKYATERGGGERLASPIYPKKLRILPATKKNQTVLLEIEIERSEERGGKVRTDRGSVLRIAPDNPPGAISKLTQVFINAQLRQIRDSRRRR